MTRWLAYVRAFLLRPLREPTTTRRSRLSKPVAHEITIYLSEDNTLYVHHLCLTGKGQAEIAIRMCWEAMQHLAMKAGLGINLPVQAAVPVDIVRPPQPEPVPASAENGSH